MGQLQLRRLALTNRMGCIWPGWPGAAAPILCGTRIGAAPVKRRIVVISALSFMLLVFGATSVWASQVGKIDIAPAVTLEGLPTEIRVTVTGVPNKAPGIEIYEPSTARTSSHPPHLTMWGSRSTDLDGLRVFLGTRSGGGG